MQLMRRLLLFWILVLPASVSFAEEAVLLTIHDAIGPATADYFIRGVKTAQEQNAGLVILELDTPGGLDASMRDMIQTILSADVPVATYVSPGGSRAASAGTYLLYASHVAAMAPATNLGSATPVPISGGDDWNPTKKEPPVEPPIGTEETPTEKSEAPVKDTAMQRKVINDAVAYIRSLAQLRGRNAEWAEAAVVDAVNITANEALDINVIDVVATDVSDLLRQVDGTTVDLDGTEVTLSTQGMTVTRIDPDWRTQLLSIITNPSVAAMLLLVGIYGLLLEGYNPGALVPGIVGAIAALLALYAFQVLPVNYAGLGLIILGVILMAAEFFVPSFGALGLGGIVAFVVGSIILIDSDMPGFGVSPWLIGSVATAGALGVLGIIYMADSMRRRRPVSGAEQMLGATAEALQDFDEQGTVFVHGERWNAVTRQPISKGQRVRIHAMDGLTVHVEPVSEN